MKPSRARLRSVERAAVADEIASFARHDLRNRLAAISNASAYLEQRAKRNPFWESDPRIETFFSLITAEIRKANTLIADRLPPSAADVEERSAVPLAEIVEYAVAANVPPETIVIEMRVEPSLRVEADAHELIVAFECLVVNALEAMHDGGRLTVEADEDDAAVTVSIRDTGPGFVTATDPFAPRTTTKPGHAGLGLGMARRLVGRCGGQIRVNQAASGWVSVELRRTVEREGSRT